MIKQLWDLGIAKYFCFLVQSVALAIQTSLGLPKLNMKESTKWILVAVVKCHHLANTKCSLRYYFNVHMYC